MSKKTSGNISASVRQRLFNMARKDNRPFSELLQYYAMERFLYRLSQSPFADRFILKGALMLRAWRSPEFRPTMDIDLLGKITNEETVIVSCIQDILSVDVEPDGLVFDTDSIQSERITVDAEYEGIRIRFRGVLDSARIPMQVDIGFGDIVSPSPEETELPAMLEYPVARVLCYSRESAIAEKFEAMLKLGDLNSRMKDFYDIWLLCRQFDFNGERLTEAIRLTLDRRGTRLTNDIAVFSDDFADSKQRQWTAFRQRMQQDHVPASFLDIIRMVTVFLDPITHSLRSGIPVDAKWIAPGLWKEN